LLDHQGVAEGQCPHLNKALLDHQGEAEGRCPHLNKSLLDHQGEAGGGVLIITKGETGASPNRFDAAVNDSGCSGAMTACQPSLSTNPGQIVIGKIIIAFGYFIFLT